MRQDSLVCEYEMKIKDAFYTAGQGSGVAGFYFESGTDVPSNVVDIKRLHCRKILQQGLFVRVSERRNFCRPSGRNFEYILRNSSNGSDTFVVNNSGDFFTESVSGSASRSYGPCRSIMKRQNLPIIISSTCLLPRIGEYGIWGKSLM
jgi:hypothetical protein